MTRRERVVLLISADAGFTREVDRELTAGGARCQLPLAAGLAEARQALRSVVPTVILLDESALQTGDAAEGDSSVSFEAIVAGLAESAPVVVIAAPERQTDLVFFMSSGAVDFVARAGNFLPVAIGFLERRMELAERAERGSPGTPAAVPASDFGEILRHEVNNPLTGILGNAELLLAECRKNNGEPLSHTALQRAQTIADLAVRLRETVRRLSNAWESWHDHARPA